MSTWPTAEMGESTQNGRLSSPQKMLPTRSVVANGLPTPPVHSPQASYSSTNRPGTSQQVPTNGTHVEHPANTEILMESLIKLADPDFQIGEMQGSVRFSEIDKDLVLDLLRAVGGVCNQILKSERKQEVRAVKVMRRRLDESRQLLEGQGED